MARYRHIKSKRSIHSSSSCTRSCPCRRWEAKESWRVVNEGASMTNAVMGNTEWKTGSTTNRRACFCRDTTIVVDWEDTAEMTRPSLVPPANPLRRQKDCNLPFLHCLQCYSWSFISTRYFGKVEGLNRGWVQRRIIDLGMPEENNIHRGSTLSSAVTMASAKFHRSG